MGENAFDSSTGRNGLLCSSLFSLSWCLLSFLALMSVYRPTVVTKSFDSASYSILSHGPTG